MIDEMNKTSGDGDLLSSQTMHFRLPVTQQDFLSHFSQYPFIYTMLLGSAVLLLRSLFGYIYCDGIKAPYVGYRSIFEPSWLVRLRFSKGALPQINEGYEKVCVSVTILNLQTVH
jgi:hypothetical protein